MSDQDFNFAPPPQKREKPKPFEPPPWEQSQFEELERRKAAEKAAADQAREAEATLAAASTAVIEPPAPKADGGEDAKAAVPEAQPAEAANDADAAVRAPRPAATPADAEAVSKTVDAMLVQLKGEEPPVGQGIWKVSLAVSFVLVVIGIAISAVGLVALSKQLGPTGNLGGTVLLVFGIAFIGIGIWVTYQTLRQRGVL